jgi:regulator of protease activity HflC (stomatin/prohibitin superfamily)
MSWQVWVFAVILIIAGIIGIVALFMDSPDDRRPTMVIAGIVAAVAVLVLFTGCLTFVSTRTFAVQTSFGRPVGEAFNNGPHWKAPWTITHDMDGAVQIDQYKQAPGSKDGDDNDHRILVRLGNSSTARADVSIRWQMKQGAASELYQQYKEFSNVRTNLVERNLAVALNEVFATFDPLAPQNLQVSPFPALAKQAADILRNTYTDKGVKLSDQVDIIDVNVPTIGYDDGTETKINLINAQRADTAKAIEQQKTNEEQAKANNNLRASVSNDPNVIVQNCINGAIAKGISPFGCWPGAGAMPTAPVK